LEASKELKTLAAILADWAKDRTLTIFLYGSRVRGDNRSDSDLDIHIAWSKSAIDSASMHWWGEVNNDLFKAINAKLPGPLQILEEQDPLHYEIEAGEVVHEDGNVKCAFRAPKRI
jgi:predicted nucleotidyltransferase